VYFDLKTPQNPTFGSQEEFIMVDGVGRLSHPLQLRARRLVLGSFKPSDRDIIKKTRDSKAAGSPDRGSLSVIILKDDELLGTQLEQWAVEYASKFVHAAGPEFYPTTMAIILGTAYVKKGLPEVSSVRHLDDNLTNMMVSLPLSQPFFVQLPLPSFFVPGCDTLRLAPNLLRNSALSKQWSTQSSSHA
jgi:hypothetical protein